ncbi:MAG: nucleoside-diphosphate sugar epimerase [Ignavibacteria bacterium RBG_16_36_9]|nr:MAG: nucleoside-diphosphate sugar epimerase [Ignavibacteria bacterium RBG_16_36_9]
MNSKQIAAVTGANGFVGSHLVDYLLGKNFEVRCIVRKSSNLQWLQGKDVKIFDCGLFDKKALREAFIGVNYIFHVAGVVKAKDEEGYFKGNVEATRVLLEAASEVKDNIKKFIIASSQTVSGPAIDRKPVTEEMKPNPLTTYARSKLKQEQLALSYKDVFPVTICRAPAIYGERDTEIFIYFQVFNKGLTTMIGFDKKELSLLHVADLAEGLYLAAISEKANGEIYFISSEKFYTWDEIGEITSRVLNKKAFRIRIPHFIVFTIAAVAQFFAMFSSKPATLNIEKAKDLTQRYWICDTSKAMKELGYRQKVSVEEGIKRTCDWYKLMKWI